jgi:uracil phosphoribosyltransferase
MIYNLGSGNSLVTQYVSEMRDSDRQKDRGRFRENMERLGQIFAYEISKHLAFRKRRVSTPMGAAECFVLDEQPVLATILRAGLPLHQGLLKFFDRADCAFISAYRKHDSAGKFEIDLGYCSSPSLDNRTLIVSDPMLATGSSMVKTLDALFETSKPAQVHIVCVIACTAGIERVSKHFPNAKIWAGAVDEKLDDNSFIIPGLGDAGDLAYGSKLQN